MGFLLPNTRSNSNVKPQAALRVQTALQGQPIAVLLGGQNRLPCNLIDYTDFTALPQSQGGGKGFLVSGKGSPTSYKYEAAVICAICEGPIASIDAVWNSKTKQTLASMNLTAFLGTYAQSAWGYMTSAHPTRALTYRGIAYAASGPMQLGDVGELPNLNFEVTATNANAIAGATDADPADCITDFLTNTKWGVGFPSALIGTFSNYSNYCLATGMVVSPVLIGQTAAQSFMADLCKATNSEPRWSGGLLDIVPYGDEDITANGFTFTAVTDPEYDLTDDDFITPDGGDAIIITRAPQSGQLNHVSVEYLNRLAEPDPSGDSRAYDPAVVEAKDDADIQEFGIRSSDKRQWHFFCITTAAQQSAQLELGRQQVRNSYAFTVDPSFILLDVMDIVTLTDEALGLDRKPVRIKEITENPDRSLSMVAEDYLIGSANAPLYGAEANAGETPDYNQDPGDINTPNLFEPTDQLGGALQIWLPISGQDSALWGGCMVYVSSDGDTYTLVGKIDGPSRTGYLSAPLATYAENPIGQTIDQTNTLSITLAESEGALTSGSQADALALNTVCRVGDEYIAYQTATLTGANTYDLTYLVRGAFGTEANIAAHAATTPFTRIDDSILKLPFTPDRVGQTVNFKFCSFNIWGGGQQALADVGAFAYVIAGTALASPLPDIENLRMTFVDNTSALTWDELDDFRPVRYELRKGDTWDSGIVIGNVAHPPFTTYGDGTYWVAGITQPVAGLTVYSETPVSIVVTGSVLQRNVIATHDESGGGWPGVVYGAGIITGGIFKTTIDNQVAYYEIPESDWFNVNYARPVRLSATWRATGEAVGQNILSIADFLALADVLGALNAQYVTSFVEVAVAASGTPTDIFAGYADVFVPADIFSGDLTWASWVKFAPGVYFGKWFKFRLTLESFDSGTIGDAVDFTVTADVDDRVDHLVDHALIAGGETITFAPDGGTATAFKGGPNGAITPNIVASIRNATAGDDLQITAISLSQATFQVKNGGVGVARNIDAAIQGW